MGRWASLASYPCLHLYISYPRTWPVIPLNTQIGYKLAFNYLKAQRLVDAAATAAEVLRMHPAYPRIRKEVLEKARVGLRP